MQILEYIPQLAAAGAMGVSILCVLRVYSLLKAEQQKDEPRPAILRSIYVFMGFGLVMTLVALGIEVSRFAMGTGDGELAEVTKELAKLEGEVLYGMNRRGNPTAIKLEAAGKTYEIAALYPDTTFGDTPLIIVPQEGKYKVAKEITEGNLYYGVLPEDKLRALFPCTNPPPAVPQPLNTYAAGRGYTPDKVAKRLKPSAFADLDKAIPLILEVARNPDADITLRKEAVQLLIQPDVLENLNEEALNVLVDLLSTDDLRKIPYRYYEIAQVYLSRYHLAGDTNEADLESHLEFSRNYIDVFERKGWTAESRPGEYAYYRSAAKAIGKEPSCDTCLIGQ